MMHEKAGVRTVVRFRPPNAREKGLGYTEGANGIALKQPGTITVTMGEGGVVVDPKHFQVNKVFGGDTTQKDVFDATGKDTVADVFKGYNGTIFAYGQTGAGKSFSMFGIVGDAKMEGIIPRTMRTLFSNIYNSGADVEYKIACSYVEIYKEELRDLLAVEQKRLTIRQSPHKGIYVENLHLEYVESENDVYDCLQVGNEQRKTGRTNMNAQSSRSHCVFTLYVEQSDNDGTTKQAKLNLVDLAGSEKVRKSGASGETLEEAKKINLSLTCLSQCINALTSGKASHVPYRTSKLTRLLQESLGGNAKTTLLVACSPSVDNIEETVASLRFAERCMTIKNDVVANIQLSAEQLTQMVATLTAELTELKKYAGGMEKKLKAMGVSVEGFEELEESKQDSGTQHPEHARIRPQDLAPAPDNHQPHIIEIGDAPDDEASPSPQSHPPQPLHKPPSMLSLPSNGSQHLQPSASYFETKLSWVNARVTLSGYTREGLGEEGSESFASAVWACVEGAGVERDDVFVNKVEDVGDDVVEIHPVIACDSPMVDDVLKLLNAKIKSGELTNELLQRGVLKNKRDIHVHTPMVEEKKDDEHEAALQHSQLARVERLASIVGGQHPNLNEGFVVSEELERLSKQRVEDEAELEALRAEVVRLKEAQSGLEEKCDMLQLEVDSTKERLITANTKLLASSKQNNNNNKPKPEDKAKLDAARRLSQSPKLAPSRPRPGSRAFTSRINDDEEDDDEAPRHTLFHRLRHRIKLPELPSHRERPGTNIRVLDGSQSSEETERGVLQQVARVTPENQKDANLIKNDSLIDMDVDGLAALSSEYDSNFKIPSLQLSSMSGVGAVPPLAVQPKGDFVDPVAPRRREDEELDELLKKQEELSKTVRRQQGLIERQADALQKVGERAHKAEQEALLLTQEREEMEERIMRLELKLHKHGLGERRGSVANLERRPSILGGSGPARQASEPPTSGREGSLFSESFKLERTASNVSEGYDTFRNGGGGDVPAIPKLAPAQHTSRGSRKITLPSQRERPPTVRPSTGRPHTGRPHTGRGILGGGTIRNPVRDQKNSAVGRARQGKGNDDGVLGGLLNAPSLLSSFFFDDQDPSPVKEENEDGEEEEEEQEEEDEVAKGKLSPARAKPRSFFGF